MDIETLKQQRAALITRIDILKAYRNHEYYATDGIFRDRVDHDLREAQERERALGREIEGYSKSDSQL
jgi:hypothetical protein